jgi:hypothetical protein
MPMAGAPVAVVATLGYTAGGTLAPAPESLGISTPE